MVEVVALLVATAKEVGMVLVLVLALGGGSSGKG